MILNQHLSRINITGRTLYFLYTPQLLEKINNFIKDPEEVRGFTHKKNTVKHFKYISGINIWQVLKNGILVYLIFVVSQFKDRLK